MFMSSHMYIYALKRSKMLLLMGMVSHVWSLLMIVAVNAIWSFYSLPWKSPCVMCKSSNWICHGCNSCVNFPDGQWIGLREVVQDPLIIFHGKTHGFRLTNEAIPICLKINPNDPMNHHVSWLTPMVQYCSWNIFVDKLTGFWDVWPAGCLQTFYDSASSITCRLAQRDVRSLHQWFSWQTRGKSMMNGGFNGKFHYKLLNGWMSIAMFDYQMITCTDSGM